MRDPYSVNISLCMLRIWTPLLLVFICMAFHAAPFSRGSGRQRTLRTMFWNVENLFDTVHDEGFQDTEFLPESERRWNSHRYWRKMTELARVIAAVAEDEGVPDILGLCEVENDSVLTTFAHRSILRNLGYDYVMTHSEDERGVDVALLYQPARFALIDSRSIRVPSKEHGFRPTRDILYARGRVLTSEGIDTLHVLVVHLPSRAGGHEGDRNRALAAQTLWLVADSIVVTGGKLVVMGDFNASARDRIFRHSNLCITDDSHAIGTYCFQGTWQWLDHILVSPSLSTSGPARPVQLPWLLEPNKTNGGEMPYRTFRGPSYNGGISDHLAVVLNLIL